MTEQPEQLMSHGSDIAMTNSEQSVMRRKLLAYTLTNPPRTSRVAAPFSWARRHAVAASMLVVLVAVGATGVSANMAGPNDLLYDFKLQVNDRIESAITFDDEAQFDVEMRQIERQLNAEDGALDVLLSDEAEFDRNAKNEDERNEADESRELNIIENVKENLKARLGSGRTPDDHDRDDRDDSDEREEDDNLDAELREMERELQREESTQIDL